MRILALQLKRIGDLVLTTPALAALRAAWPEALLTLGVADGCAPLLGAIPSIDGGAVFGKGRGFAPWQQALTGPWDLCFDFTGTDRSALATALSRAGQRVTFSWVQKKRIRALAYSRFIESAVRERHTVDHYLDLVRAVMPPERFIEHSDPAPELRLAASHSESAPFALLHPGTARAEKFWLPERWSAVADALWEQHGLRSIITAGPDEFERAHAAQAQSTHAELALPADLLELASLVSRATIVVSCDTAVVHLAAAFHRPQVALFGPTNPFHWRPRHARAVVLSAAKPDAPLTEFQPRMKGAPMDRISTDAVIRATESVLAH